MWGSSVSRKTDSGKGSLHHKIGADRRSVNLKVDPVAAIAKTDVRIPWRETEKGVDKPRRPVYIQKNTP